MKTRFHLKVAAIYIVNPYFPSLPIVIGYEVTSLSIQKLRAGCPQKYASFVVKFALLESFTNSTVLLFSESKQ